MGGTEGCPGLDSLIDANALEGVVPVDSRTLRRTLSAGDAWSVDGLLRTFANEGDAAEGLRVDAERQSIFEEGNTLVFPPLETGRGIGKVNPCSAGRLAEEPPADESVGRFKGDSIEVWLTLAKLSLSL